jgi:hypothetical protein
MFWFTRRRWLTCVEEALLSMTCCETTPCSTCQIGALYTGRSLTGLRCAAFDHAHSLESGLANIRLFLPTSPWRRCWQCLRCGPRRP